MSLWVGWLSQPCMLHINIEPLPQPSLLGASYQGSISGELFMSPVTDFSLYVMGQLILLRTEWECDCECRVISSGRIGYTVFVASYMQPCDHGSLVLWGSDA